eukprot:1157331-Pelagomonas_calceolata.AAC.2
MPLPQVAIGPSQSKKAIPRRRRAALNGFLMHSAASTDTAQHAQRTAWLQHAECRIDWKAQHAQCIVRIQHVQSSIDWHSTACAAHCMAAACAEQH